jgi:membrane associated rhomboid family serine protease
MPGPQQSMSLAFPKPGRALKLLLVVIFVLGIFNALLATWVPHGDRVFAVLQCDFERVRSGQLWRLLTSGLLTSPNEYGHLIFTLIGLYFLAPDLERRWGDARFLRFFAYAVLAGNLAVLLVGLGVPAGGGPSLARFAPQEVFGASAAVSAIAVAWSHDNASRTVQLFFVVPVRGAWLLWITLAVCVLDLIYPTALPEGVVAPFGGVAVGLLFGGTPSRARAVWLRLKLVVLRRRARSLSAADVLSTQPRRPRPGSPPLRVLPGGIEEQLKKRNPPKDKRFLN